MTLELARFEFKPQDAWIGAFWRTDSGRLVDGTIVYYRDIWICFVPCFPIHFRLTWRTRTAFTTNFDG